MPLTRLEKTLIGVTLGAVLGGIAGALIARSGPPLTLPENQTSPGFNEANLGTAVEAGASIGGFTGAILGLAA